MQASSLSTSFLHRWLDALGAQAALFLLAEAVFLLWWGAGLYAALAGLCFYFLLALLRFLYRKKNVRSKENAIRQRIGGENSLFALLTAPEMQGHLFCALYLCQTLHLHLIKNTPQGCVADKQGKRVLVRFLPLDRQDKLTPGHVYEGARQAAQAECALCLLCAPCTAGQRAKEIAAGLTAQVTLVEGEQLRAAAGRYAPADDSLLREMGRQKRKKGSAREWRELVLQKKRAKRYFLYGTMLLLLYKFTGLPYYPAPGFLLLCLGVLAYSWHYPRKA